MVKKKICIILVITITFVLLILGSCGKSNLANNSNINKSETNQEFLEKIKKINYDWIDEKCYSIIKGELIKVTEVKFDNSLLKEEDKKLIDISKIPYVSLIIKTNKSTGKNILDGNIEIIVIDGQFSKNFFTIGNEYIFSIVKSPWIIDKNFIYSRVNTLLIDKNDNVLINDDGEKKPLSYEKDIFK